MNVRELTKGETALAHAALRELRPAWADRDAWVARVDGVQRPEGYRLVAAFADAPDAVAAAGFRVVHHLAWGRTLYVDDLVTLPAARGRGHARVLLDWLGEEARRQGCDELHLDSGFGPRRADAHRLYLNTGLAVTSLHFSRSIR